MRDNLVMPKLVPAAFLMALACWVGGCESRQAPASSASPSQLPPNQDRAPVDLGAIAIGEGKCQLDTNEPGPLRRIGRASVALNGEGVAIAAKDVKALCGPMFNTDVPALGIVAGQGLLFEVCLPEGIVQLNAEKRSAGKHSLREGAEAGGIELVFNRNRGTSYSSRPREGDSVTFSDDLWKAEAHVALTDVAERGSLRADVSFDCSAPGS